MLNETRLRLEAEQEEFVRALLESEPCPEEIDSERFQAASLILRKKRMKAVKKSWPKLVKLIGSKFKEYFFEYSQKTNQPRYQASLIDGRLFAQFLEERNLLPEEIESEVEKFDLTFSIEDGKLRKRSRVEMGLYKLALIFGIKGNEVLREKRHF